MFVFISSLHVGKFKLSQSNSTELPYFLDKLNLNKALKNKELRNPLLYEDRSGSGRFFFYLVVCLSKQNSLIAPCNRLSSSVLSRESK